MLHAIFRGLVQPPVTKTWNSEKQLHTFPDAYRKAHLGWNKCGAKNIFIGNTSAFVFQRATFPTALAVCQLCISVILVLWVHAHTCASTHVHAHTRTKSAARWIFCLITVALVRLEISKDKRSIRYTPESMRFPSCRCERNTGKGYITLTSVLTWRRFLPDRFSY